MLKAVAFSIGGEIEFPHTHPSNSGFRRNIWLALVTWVGI